MLGGELASQFEAVAEYGIKTDEKGARDRGVGGLRFGMRARSRLFEMCKVIRMPNVEDYRVRKSR